MSSHEDDKIVESLTTLMAHHGVQFLIQVGAGDGYEANCIGNATGCRVIAIEGNTVCSPIQPELEFHHIVIGATNSVMPWYVHKNADLSGHFSRGHNSEETTYQSQHMRLDYFCGVRYLEADALIIDTEGSTLEVLEGCGFLLDKLKVVYAECQTQEDRPGIRLLGEVDKFLVVHGMTQHQGPPAYSVGPQGNYTWVRP